MNNQVMKHINASLILLLCMLTAANLASANVVGPDPENFNPTTNGLDFVTVQSSETLEPGIVNLGLFSDYAANTLPHFDNLVTYSRVNLNDFLLFGHLNAGVGLGKNWDVGVTLPYLLREEVRDANYSGVFYSTGLLAVEVNSKYRFFGDNSHGLAFIGTVNLNLLNDNPFSGRNPGPIYNAELAYDTTFKQFALGVNVGFRFRNPGTPIAGIPVEPLKNQYIGSLAASYLFSEYDTKVIFEIFGSYPAESAATFSDRRISTLEALLGVKHDFSQQVAFHAGAGTGLFNGTSSPSWRVYAGLNIALGPFFAKDAAPSMVSPPVTSVAVSAAPAQPPPSSNIVVTGELIFKFNSDAITEDGAKLLGQLAESLKTPPVFKSLVISGHTDTIGNAAYNNYLSELRAQSAKKVLVERFQVDAKKIQTVGYGPTRPIADNGNYQGRRKNRRVEFQIER
jgi:outer membrane protein OmpA-like peptidoglycan-associated protein